MSPVSAPTAVPTHVPAPVPASSGPDAPPEPAHRLRVRSADGVQINVEIHGPDDAPTVVLSHGWTCSTYFWAPVIRALRDDVRVVAYDQRGHGASEVPGQGHYSVQALVDDLTAVLDATLADGSKAVLAGHSMGGMTVMAAAFRASVLERTAGVLLASTGFHELATRARVAPFAARFPRYAKANQRITLHSTLPLGPVTPVTKALLKRTALGPKSSKELVTVNARIIQACPRGSRAAWGRVLYGLDLADAVRKLDVPTALVFGTEDRLTPVVHAREIAENLPCFEGLTELPGIGHMTPLEAPNVVAHLIRERIAASRTSPASLASSVGRTLEAVAPQQHIDPNGQDNALSQGNHHDQGNPHSHDQQDQEASP